MIIIKSQDKKKIVKCRAITMYGYLEKGYVIYGFISSSSSNGWDGSFELGKYKTEEKAKQIMGEIYDIIDTYPDRRKIYEMPIE